MLLELNGLNLNPVDFQFKIIKEIMSLFPNK